MQLKLKVITCSTRPNRVGPTVSNWFMGVAEQYGESFDSEHVDLAELKLPLFDEPEHPRTQKYQHEHTKAWSQIVASADAFVFVTPEYNYGPPPSFVNALTYLAKEWAYKPAAFVSYGGLSGGMRAVQIEKMLLTTLKVVPLVEAVVIPTVTQQLDAQREFVASEVHLASARLMLQELAAWAVALKTMR